MAIKFIAIKCPECGASLDIEKGRKTMFCSYCGHKIMMVDENEYRYIVTHRYIDDAKIKEAEEKTKIETVRNNNKKDNLETVATALLGIFTCVVIICFLIFGYLMTK